MQTTGPAFERYLIPALFRTRVYRAARRVNRGTVAIAMYHGFTAADSHGGIENHEGKHVHVRQFRDQLTYLKSSYNVIPLGDVVRALTTGSPLPDRPLAITVDDGYRSTYTVAYPALREFQLPASVFLATEFVDGRQFLWTDRVEFAIDHAKPEALILTIRGTSLNLDVRTAAARKSADRRLRSILKAMPQASRLGAVEAVEHAAGCCVSDAREGTGIYEPLTWDEASEMSRSGLVSFGSHTHTHVILARCDPARIAEELATSKRIIEGQLGIPCDLFCYPNGRKGDFNANTAALLRAHGYAGALTTVYGMNARDADVYELRRYNLGKPMMSGEVEVRLSGLMDLGSVLRRAKPTRAPG